MRFATVCSGIEAPSVAWSSLGWEPVFFSEIEKFPSRLLRHHYHGIINHGDMNDYKEWPDYGELGLICGGTPCQSFSIAGLRKGMDNPRGNLSLVFLGILLKYRPRWFIWENVPGVLSSSEGRDFGTFVRGLGELGYSLAGRVMDAQYFGVPQRRRRVFIVGYLGKDWRPPLAVLFEPESLRRNPPMCKEKGEDVARPLRAQSQSSYLPDYETYIPGAIGLDEQCNAVLDGFPTLTSSPQGGNQKNVAVYDTHGHDSRIVECEEVSPTVTSRYGTGGGNTPLVLATGQGVAEIAEDLSPTLNCNHEAPIVLQNDRGAYFGQNGAITQEDKTFTLNTVDKQVVAFKVRGGKDTYIKKDGSIWTAGKGILVSEDKAFTIRTVHDQNLQTGSIVRRLTPVECERLQGFPDNYTLVPGIGRYISKHRDEIFHYLMSYHGFSEESARELSKHPDSVRYKALGNSMAVPVVEWIGRRIELMNNVLQEIGDRPL